MTAIRPVQIACDGNSERCETRDDVIVAQHPAQSISDVRAELRLYGWISSGGKDLCRECQQARCVGKFWRGGFQIPCRRRPRIGKRTCWQHDWAEEAS